MSIRKIPYSDFSIEATLELAKQCAHEVSNRHPEDDMLDGTATALDEPIQKAELTIANSRKEELIEEIEESDFRRDRAFVGFRKYIEAYQFKDWDRPKQKAAANLMVIIERHGTRLYREGLKVQSALLESLFESLNNEQSFADMATLDAKEWLDRLKKLQNDFSSLLHQRDDLEAKKDTIPTSEAARADIEKCLSLLLSGLDFLANTQPHKYVATSESINSIIEQITDKYK